MLVETTSHRLEISPRGIVAIQAAPRDLWLIDRSRVARIFLATERPAPGRDLEATLVWGIYGDPRDFQLGLGLPSSPVVTGSTTTWNPAEAIYDSIISLNSDVIWRCVDGVWKRIL